MSAIKMVLSLALALVLIWGLYRLARRTLPYGKSSTASGLIQVLESRYLGMKKSIAIVRVPGTILVLGLGADRINLLTRIDNPDILATIDTAGSANKAVSFREQLRRLTRSQ